MYQLKRMHSTTLFFVLMVTFLCLVFYPRFALSGLQAGGVVSSCKGDVRYIGDRTNVLRSSDYGKIFAK